MVERIRWCIANLVDRLPGQCWTELVLWALDGMRSSRHKGDNPLPWRPIDDLCRRDLERNGGCYCAKLRQPEGAATDGR